MSCRFSTFFISPLCSPGKVANLGILARRGGEIVVDSTNNQDATINIVNFGATLTGDSEDVMILDFTEVDNDPFFGQPTDINANISLKFKNAKLCQPLSDILNTTIVVP